MVFHPPKYPIQDPDPEALTVFKNCSLSDYTVWAAGTFASGLWMYAAGRPFRSVPCAQMGLFLGFLGGMANSYNNSHRRLIGKAPPK